MTTYLQSSKLKVRASKKFKSRIQGLQGAPQRKGVCVKVTTTKPKKPNSAIRKIAKIRLSTGYIVRASIPGQGHNLQQYSVVRVRSGRVRDIPGIHFKIIRGAYDFTGSEKFRRGKRRSKFGIKLIRESGSMVNLKV